jgi:hypothetical protein
MMPTSLQQDPVHRVHGASQRGDSGCVFTTAGCVYYCRTYYKAGCGGGCFYCCSTYYKVVRVWGGGGTMEDMCYEGLRAEACVD